MLASKVSILAAENLYKNNIVLFQPFVVPLRVLMLLGGGLFAVFGSEAINLEGAGPLGAIAAAFMSMYFWCAQGWDIENVRALIHQ